VNGLSERLLAGSVTDGDTVEVRLDRRGFVEFVATANMA
jgi:hypothetical protein